MAIHIHIFLISEYIYIYIYGELECTNAIKFMVNNTMKMIHMSSCDEVKIIIFLKKIKIIIIINYNIIFKKISKISQFDFKS